MELQNIQARPPIHLYPQPVTPTRKVTQPLSEPRIRTIRSQVERLEPEEIHPQRTLRTQRDNHAQDLRRIASPEEREERRVRDRIVDADIRRVPLRVPNSEMPERVRSPYERTVREIRQEVHMWQQSQHRNVR